LLGARFRFAKSGDAMVARITNQKLYHVTLTKPYKRAFTENQVARIGDADNPFF